MTDAEVREALSVPNVVALTVIGEAGGEPLLGRVAVAQVIGHRVRHVRRWSRDWRRVCLQRAQFSCWSAAGGGNNYERVMALARRLTGGGTLFEYHEVLWIVDGVMSGDVRDIVSGATHYYAPRAMRPRGSVPPWAEGHEPVAVIGGHRFYKL